MFSALLACWTALLSFACTLSTAALTAHPAPPLRHKPHQHRHDRPTQRPRGSRHQRQDSPDKHSSRAERPSGGAGRRLSEAVVDGGRQRQAGQCRASVERALQSRDQRKKGLLRLVVRVDERGGTICETKQRGGVKRVARANRSETNLDAIDRVRWAR